MNDIRELQEQCTEIEKIVNDIRAEVVGIGDNSLELLAKGLEVMVTEMSQMIDIIIMGE